MPRTLVAELKDHLDSTVELRGWAQAIRDQKNMQFLVLRDETGLAQLILPKQDPPSELNEAISALTPESAVTITGLVVADERVKLGGLEIQLASLTVDSPADGAGMDAIRGRLARHHSLLYARSRRAQPGARDRHVDA